MRISQVLAALTVLLSVAAASPWFYPRVKEQNKAAQQQQGIIILPHCSVIVPYSTNICSGCLPIFFIPLAKEQSDELLKSVMQYLKSGAETENG